MNHRRDLTTDYLARVIEYKLANDIPIWYLWSDSENVLLSLPVRLANCMNSTGRYRHFNFSNGMIAFYPIYFINFINFFDQFSPFRFSIKIDGILPDFFLVVISLNNTLNTIGTTVDF